VSVTAVPALNDALHVGEQLIPVGLLVTVPVEVPASVTVSSYVVAGVALAAPDADCANSFPGWSRAIATTRLIARKRSLCRFTVTSELEFENKA